MEFQISEAGQGGKYVDGVLKGHLKGILLICSCLKTNVACRGHGERKSNGPKLVPPLGKL